jgi:hypothetical protein
LDCIDFLQGDTIICGDFNCPGQIPLSVDSRLLTLFTDRNFKQHIEASTRKQNGNILDLVFARLNSVLISSNTIVISEVSFSDHNLICFPINIARPIAKVETFSFRNLKCLDINTFQNIIKNSPIWRTPPTTVDDFYQQFEHDVVAALDQLAPLKHGSKRISNHPTGRWMSTEAASMKCSARRLERAWKKNKTEESYIQFRKAGRAASKAVKAARINFYQSELSNLSNNSRARWRLIKEVLHTNESQGQVSAAASKRLAASFTLFFRDKLAAISSNIISKLSASRSSRPPVISSSPSMPLPTLAPVSLSEVDQLLRSTPTKSSPLDFIPTSLLITCSEVFAPIIANLTNLSFSQGAFPSRLKIAQVTPLLKKPGLDPNLPVNYRPISNLNTIGKLIERLALVRLCPHITSNPNFSSLQSGFRPGHSTETAMLSVCNSLFTSVANRRTSLLCTIDLSAAFDTINHDLLLERLKSDFGLDGTTGSWLKSYLVGRQQFVKVGNSTGQVAQITSGVPQGSVLGPILFTSYMSPICRLIESHGISQHHYADDSTLFIELDSAVVPPPQLIHCIEDLSLWCLHNSMQINPDKTEAMLIGPKAKLQHLDQTQPVSLAGTNISLSRSIKILGVTLDPQLSFDAHVSSICQSCNFHLRALRHIRPLLSLDLAKQLACSIVSSRLDYCNSLLSNTSQHNISRLQTVQNNLARIVCNVPPKTSAGPLLKQLHWLPIEQRIAYKIASTTYTVLENGSPEYLHNVLNPYVPTRCLRSASSHLLTAPHTGHLLSAANKAFFSASPHIWNRLSPATRSATSLPRFKHLLKTELFLTAFSAQSP